jgi:hypothetical protein
LIPVLIQTAMNLPGEFIRHRPMLRQAGVALAMTMVMAQR